MSDNTFGRLFRMTTFGESHGPAIGCVIDGCPPGLEIDADYIQKELTRRATGKSRHTSQRKEKDEVQILSGVFEGRTTGASIGLVIENTDARSKDYTDIAEKFRPGHADFTYWKKYGFRDYRGGGRSSARETTMRVAAGAIARKYLFEKLGIEIQGWLAQLGPIRTDGVMEMDSIDDNPFFSPDTSCHQSSLKITWTAFENQAIPLARGYQRLHEMFPPVLVSRFMASWMQTWRRR